MAKSSFLHKLCKRVAYGVAIRPLGAEDQPFRVKYPSPLKWYADPFVCSEGENTYVFVELLHSYHVDGEIAVARVEQGRIGKFRTVIREPFHMSFPNVFQWQGAWYMLPETCQSGQLRLYRARRFPYDWELSGVLLEGRELVDHALYPTEDGFFILTYDQTEPQDSRNRIFHLHMDSGRLEEIFPQGNWCRERPGGTFYRAGEKWRHVVQECRQGVYGEYLHVFEVEHFDRERFEEREIRQVHMQDLAVSPDNGRLQYLHTYNRNADYEVIDVRYDKIYPDKFFIHQWEEIRKRLKKGRKRK